VRCRIVVVVWTRTARRELDSRGRDAGVTRNAAWPRGKSRDQPSCADSKHVKREIDYRLNKGYKWNGGRRHLAAAELLMATDLHAVVADARGARPPLEVVASTGTGSFDDAAVELRDEHVLWRIVRERSVLGLIACPEFDRSVWYDAPLLRRFLGYGSETWRGAAPGSPEALREPTTNSVENLVREIEQLRQPVAAAFAASTWDMTRVELLDLGHRRDAELFGRPYGPLQA
jgi:hypothetical protein